MTRTRDLLITNELLYQLSYSSILFCASSIIYNCSVIFKRKNIFFIEITLDFHALACYHMNTFFKNTKYYERSNSFSCINAMTPFKNSYVDELYDAILSLENKEDCRDFFEDLFTINEIISLSQRLSVAKKLDEGKTFSVITAETGASSATIGRVNKCLSYGTGGYRKIIDRLKNESDESK